jgi:hypothetical protein
MLSKIAVVAAVATGAYAAPSTTSESCTWGAPLSNGKYVFDAAGLTALECTAYRINVARSIQLTGIAAWIDNMAGLTNADMDIKTEWPNLAAVVVGETCPAVAGDPMQGGACTAWTDFNATHPAEIATGIIPDSHTMVNFCIDNMNLLDSMMKKLVAPGNKATAVGNLAMYAYFDGLLAYCRPMMHDPSVAMGGAPCRQGDVYGSDKIDWGAQSVKCCESVHNLAAYHILKNDSSVASLSTKVVHCPSHVVAQHGGCVSGTNMPTTTAMQNSQDFIREEGCACGAAVMSAFPADQSALKAVLDSDGDSILDACLYNFDATTTTTTTTTTKGKDSDSGAAGLTASFAAFIVAASAAIF